MTHVGPAPVATRPAGAATAPGYIEWGPIVAGALLAAALSFVLLTFGAAIGLSATSPWPNVGLSGKVIASLAIFWVLAQQIGAFLAGGYVAGRMRTRWAETPQSEAEFRDGLHGGLVWALGIVIGAALFMATAGAVAGQAPRWQARRPSRPCPLLPRPWMQCSTPCCDLPLSSRLRPARLRPPVRAQQLLLRQPVPPLGASW